MTDASKPFWAKCEPCGHVWAAAYYPMEVSKICKLMIKARCPKCASGPKGIVIAKQNNGVLNEVSA
jgi:hypothetical protein